MQSGASVDDALVFVQARPRHATRHQHATPPLPPRKPALLPSPRHGSLARLPVGCLQAANGAQSVKEVLDMLSKERRAEVIRTRGTGSSGNTNGTKVVGSGTGTGTGTMRSVSLLRSFYDVAAARIGIGSSSSSSISSNERTPTPPAGMVQPASPASPLTQIPPSPESRLRCRCYLPPLAGCIVCLSPFPYTDTHALPTTITITISIPVITSPNAAAAAAATTSSPSSPTTPSRKRPSHPFPFADIADQDHHHGRSRERVAGERWYSFKELDARLGASSNPGPNPTGSGSSMTDALQRTFATLRPCPGFESVRVWAEGMVFHGGHSTMGKGGERLVGEEEMEGKKLEWPIQRSRRKLQKENNEQCAILAATGDDRH
ncbi:hypothetical protein BU17DRAFT_64686 [Hysterangium stoloniferum]|nr:hypothetical protein BU17DRAFT_64686 [Hysterangium stoloniferum]